MAQAKRDPNRVPTLLAVSNADDSTPVRIYADPTTRRLYVDTTVTGLATAVTDGEVVDAADVGNLALGTDGTNYQVLSTDSSGRLILGASTLAIGKLAANSGVDIGDVDILSIAAGDNNIGNVDVVSIIPGTGATNQGKAVDSVAGATDTGIAPLVVRDDALGALTPIEGDYVSLRVDANGALWTHDDALDAALGGSELQVDIVGALPAGTAAIGKLAANSGVDIGDVDVLTLPAITIAAAQTLATVTTVGTVTSVTAIANALPAGTNAIGKLTANTGVDIGDVDVTSAIITSGTITTVSTVSALGIGTTGPQKAEDVAHVTGDMGIAVWSVSNEANTAFAVDGDYVPQATDTEGNTRIVGNRDHDAVDAGEVVGVGMRAIAHGTNPTAVAAADRTVWFANRAGVPFVIGGHPNVVTLEAAYTAAQTDTAIVTVAPGLKIIVTRCDFVADNANTVDVGFRIGFGAATTPTTTGVVSSHPGVAAGSGVLAGNGGGILGVGADGEDLRITCEVPTTGSVRVIVSYYTIES